MIRVSIETKSEIIIRGLQNILEGYEVLDFYKDGKEDFDILIFEDKELEKLEVEKIRLIDERDLPLVIEYSLLSYFASGHEVIEAIDKTLRGHIYIEGSLKKARAHRSDKFEKLKTLNRREKKLLEEIISGKTNKEISREIYISEKTIKNNLTHVYRKLGVSGRKEIIETYKQSQY